MPRPLNASFSLFLNFVKIIRSPLNYFFLNMLLRIKKCRNHWCTVGQTMIECPISSPQAHMTSTSTLLTIWHKRISNPHSRVLRFNFNKFSLPFHERDKHSYFIVCLSNKAHYHPFTQLSLYITKQHKIIFSDL